MRIPLFVLSLAVLLAVPACAVHVRKGGGPSHRGSYKSHRSHGPSHRHHRHWNAAGPAYSEASVLTQIAILPAALPVNIDGLFTAAEATTWRAEWPTLAAQLIADGLTTRTDGVVTGVVAHTQPTTGHYMRVVVTFLDVGDNQPNDDGTPRLFGSALHAHGVIFNAATGQLVADVKFREGSGWSENRQFEVFMARIGSSLGDWFKARRSKP